jgi:YD repeat-containing protein
MKNLAILFIVTTHALSYASERRDTLLLVGIECHLNDTILESGANYKYDDNLNQILSFEWSRRNSLVYNYLKKRTFNEGNDLIMDLTYADSVLIDSVVFKYLDNSLESSYHLSRDLNNSVITRTLYADSEKPIREEIKQVNYYYGQRKEQKLLNTLVYNSSDYLIELSRYEIGGNSSARNRMLKVGEIDTIDYTDSLLYRTRYEYNNQNQLIVEKHFMINDIHTRTRRIHYNTDGFIYKEDNWYSDIDSIRTSYTCIFFEEDGLKCSLCEDYSFPGTKFTRKLNDKGQLVEETHGGNGLMTVTRYKYNENGRLISVLVIVSYMGEITKRKTLYTYQHVNF